MRQALKTLFFIFLCFYITGCSKHKAIPTDTVPGDFIPWYVYQKGSYWVYKCNKKLSFDSTYINTGPDYWQFESQNGYIIDHITYDLNNKNIVGIDMTSAYGVLLSFCGTQIYAFLQFVNEGGRYNNYDRHYQYIKHYDSISINNRVFYNVRNTRMTFLYLNNRDSVVDSIWYACHVGLIKATTSLMDIDTTWVLTKYHAVQ
jgi:hypothetical protein